MLFKNVFSVIMIMALFAMIGCENQSPTANQEGNLQITTIGTTGSQTQQMGTFEVVTGAFRFSGTGEIASVYIGIAISGQTGSTKRIAIRNDDGYNHWSTDQFNLVVPTGGIQYHPIANPFGGNYHSIECSLNQQSLNIENGHVDWYVRVMAYNNDFVTGDSLRVAVLGYKTSDGKLVGSNTDTDVPLSACWPITIQ